MYAGNECDSLDNNRMKAAFQFSAVISLVTLPGPFLINSQNIDDNYQCISARTLQGQNSCGHTSLHTLSSDSD